MIEHITKDVIYKSYYLVNESKEYRALLTKKTIKDDLLKQHFTRLEYHIGKTALTPSFFVLDTFLESNMYYPLTKNNYNSIRDEIMSFDDAGKGHHLNLVLSYMLEKNELYAYNMMKLCTEYNDKAESMIVFKLLESQYYESLDTDVVTKKNI